MTLAAAAPELSIAELYKDFPLARTAGGTTYINLTDDYIAYLGFANAGMLNKGNLLCLDYALRNLQSTNPIIEIGSFCGLSTNLIGYFKQRHGVTNQLFTCDRWEFEGAEGNVGESQIPHSEYRTFVKESFIRNVRMFSRGALPHTIEMLSNDFFTIASSLAWILLGSCSSATATARQTSSCRRGSRMSIVSVPSV